MNWVKRLFGNKKDKKQDAKVESQKGMMKTISQAEFYQQLTHRKPYAFPDLEIEWHATSDNLVVGVIVLDKIEKTYTGYTWWRTKDQSFDDKRAKGVCAAYTIRQADEVLRLLWAAMKDLASQVGSTVD